MRNPETGTDDARYCSVMVVMADYMEPGDDQDRCRAMTLDRLTEAVCVEARLRVACRDTDVTASTRVRAWTVS